MVAVDILEGQSDDLQVRYCRRCGAVSPQKHWFITERNGEWRLPDPHLWRS
jgi:NMD protein affecting ribosome stability and mRNA decay